MNERIRAREVRLIDENGEMIEIMAPMRALDIAHERNLDLVEISPNAIPPVCKLMDYGKYKYEQAKKENEARKNQKTTTLKEIRLHPRTDEHDIGWMTRKIQEFLAEGDKVKVSVQFRGAEMRHPEIGRKLLEGIAEALKGSAVIERTPMMEGRVMSMFVSRAPGWESPKSRHLLPLSLANVLRIRQPHTMAQILQRLSLLQKASMQSALQRKTSLRAGTVATFVWLFRAILGNYPGGGEPSRQSHRHYIFEPLICEM